MTIKNTVALITGATGGIGSAIAKELLCKGATVVLVARQQQQLEQLKQQLLQNSDIDDCRIQLLTADLLLSDQREQLVAKVKTLTPRVNVLINNAGANVFKLFEDISEQQIERILQLNIHVPMLLTQALLPYLHQQRSAQIINIGSTLGSIGYPGFCTYSASKFALRGFSEALSRELSDSNIQIKYLSPRATKTSLNSSAVEQLNQATGTHMDEPKVVAEALVNLLMSNKQAKSIGWPEKFFGKLNQLFPSIVGQAISKDLATIRRFAQQ